MRNSLIIAGREFRERLKSRAFILFSVLGPLVVLTILYFLFAYGGKSAVNWKVLVSDKAQLLEGKMLPQQNGNLTYYFINDYIEIEEFAQAKKYQEYDALLEINEKVLSNKTGFIFYRNTPSASLEKQLVYQVERRVEEIMVDRFTNLTILDFRKIKQSLNLNFRNVYDPQDASADKRGWVGLFFGLLIFLFISLFAMTLLRGVSREKSNRIVEVLLATVRPFELMLGKILGIGFAAFVQFLIWIALIWSGLIYMRQELFPNYIESNLQIEESILDNDQQTLFNQSDFEYNEFVDLVFDRVQFVPMIGSFFLYFLGGYFFFSALFASVGASTGSESDGQQFVIPLILLMLFGMYSGYYVLQFPESEWVPWLQYLPFTSPSVSLVRLAQGYPEGMGYHFYTAFFVLLISGLFMLRMAGRIYKNGLLQFGHRLRLMLFIKWLKK